MRLSNKFTDVKKYYVKNKDNLLFSFDWCGGYNGRSEIIDDVVVYQYNTPKFILDDITSWLNLRTPPKHRKHMKELLSQLGLNSVRGIIDYSKGLSLTDTFWVTDNNDLKWCDVNLYNNAFDATIAKIAFDGGLYGLQFNSTSPELATNGALPKCWVRDACGNISLKKQGSYLIDNARGLEPYSEVMCSQILDVLGYNHVRYTIENFRGNVVSSCPLLTSQDTMMLPMWYAIESSNVYDILGYLSEVSEDMLNDMCKMLVFDYIVVNTDRHLGNVGVLLDTENFKVIGLAPIYDNGLGLFPCELNLTTDKLLNLSKDAVPKFYDSFDVLAKISKSTLGNLHNVEKLIGFKFIREELGDIPETRLVIIEQFIQQRVNEFLTM